MENEIILKDLVKLVCDNYQSVIINEITESGDLTGEWVVAPHKPMLGVVPDGILHGTVHSIVIYLDMINVTVERKDKNMVPTVKWKKEIQEKQEELLGKAEAELQEWLSQNGLIMGGGFAYKKTEDDAPEATVEPRFLEMLEDARDEYGWDFAMGEIPSVFLQRNVGETPVSITIPIQCSCQKDSFLAGLKQHALEMDGRASTPDGHCIRDICLDLYEKLSTNWGDLDDAGMPQHKYILVSVDEDMEIYTEMFHSKLTAQETMLRELIYACGQEHIDIPDEVFQNRWTEYYEKNGEFSFGPYGASIDGYYAWHIAKIA